MLNLDSENKENEKFKKPVKKQKVSAEPKIGKNKTQNQKESARKKSV